ncbi:hypothetical protein [Mobiluncus curtisii]|uniref:hypothetical protein n=1 Tax=Mobiluncus curtisii TaxID=2051 RepID=UPI0014704327|nr:hypothetical protein [Mobiluncus curtisii]NMW88950.1 hypothetical protein [Mobiluncus curtisii]
MATRKKKTRGYAEEEYKEGAFYGKEYHGYNYNIPTGVYGEPEWENLSAGAKALFVDLGAWAFKNETDGIIPGHCFVGRKRLNTVSTRYQEGYDLSELLDELVELGWAKVTGDTSAPETVAINWASQTPVSAIDRDRKESRDRMAAKREKAKELEVANVECGSLIGNTGRGSDEVRTKFGRSSDVVSISNSNSSSTSSSPVKESDQESLFSPESSVIQNWYPEGHEIDDRINSLGVNYMEVVKDFRREMSSRSEGDLSKEDLDGDFPEWLSTEEEYIRNYRNFVASLMSKDDLCKLKLERWFPKRSHARLCAELGIEYSEVLGAWLSKVLEENKPVENPDNAFRGYIENCNNRRE